MPRGTHTRARGPGPSDCVMSVKAPQGTVAGSGAPGRSPIVTLEPPPPLPPPCRVGIRVRARLDRRTRRLPTATASGADMAGGPLCSPGSNDSEILWGGPKAGWQEGGARRGRAGCRGSRFVGQRHPFCAQCARRPCLNSTVLDPERPGHPAAQTRCVVESRVPVGASRSTRPANDRSWRWR